MKLAVATLTAFLLAGSVDAANYKVGPMYNQILTIGGVRVQTSAPNETQDCTITWYDPEIFEASSTIRILGQGSSAQSPGGNVDSIFGGVRNASDGTWTVPANTSPPVLTGFNKCGLTNWLWASPSVVKVGDRYFMAFIGGNADYSKGKIYWAVSNDGASWTVYNTNPPAGEPWSPIIYPKDGIECEPFGVGQVALAWDGSYFYLFMNYIHRVKYDPNAGAQTWDSIAYRFSYNAGHPFGFGSVKQIYYDADGPTVIGPNPGSWVTHSGKLSFSYDTLPAESGDPTLTHFRSMWSLHNGGKDIEWNPARQMWVHAFSADQGNLYTQENSSLANNTWSERQQIDTFNVNGYDPWTLESGKFPFRRMQYPGIWYGVLPGQSAKMYIWIPVDWADNECYYNSYNAFEGMGIASAELIYQP